MRTLFVAVALLSFATAASACDVCGCSAGGQYTGILPQFHRHFLGLRWSEQSFLSAHTRSAARAGRFDSEESFRSIDIIGRIYLRPRLQLLTLAPYCDFRRMDLETGEETRTSGLGDISVMAAYVLLDTGDSLRRHWRHTLTLGGGVKLPAGQHRLTDAEGQLLHPNLQPGSGTTDFLLTATYTLRYGAWGLSGEAAGKINTANREREYRFGNRISGAARVFYWKNAGKFALLPGAGVAVDASQVNSGDPDYTEGTGGTALYGTAGLDVYAGRFAAGINYQHPLAGQLGGGKIENRARWTLSVNYIF
ncbi:MAG: hypothetical protein R2791_19750 [Saprospiraceae bacterium]|nr:hypothetical protein [Saprospiraceae bacterium]